MFKQPLCLADRWYTPPELAERCAQVLASAETPAWERVLHRFMLDWMDPAEAIVVETSGTTGRAKPIRVSKAAMRASARMTGRFFHLQSGDRALLCLPADHIAGQMMLVRAWELGLNLFTRAPQGLTLHDLPQMAFAALVPTQLFRLLNEEGEGVQGLACIDNLLLGGAALTPAVHERVRQLPCRVYQSYGMTETLSHVALRRLQPDPEAYYAALDGVAITVDGQGRLIIDAPHLGVERLLTNDVVRLVNSRQFEWLGRFDNVINSGGLKSHPEALERKFSAAGVPLLAEREFIVTSLVDERLGERIVLIVEGEDEGGGEALLAQLAAYCTVYECPKAVYFMRHLPRTGSGKIQRRAATERLRESRG